MAKAAANKKLHGLTKNERLCNFSLKKLLFEQGDVFKVYPFHIYWKIIDANLEDIFFAKSPTLYKGNATSSILKQQNPSWPLKKVSSNALFYYPVKCLLGVSKRSHKKAVTRNHVKRLMKEAYRKNKIPFYDFLENQNMLCLLAIVYTSKIHMSYHELEKKILVSLQKLQQEIQKIT